MVTVSPENVLETIVGNDAYLGIAANVPPRRKPVRIEQCFTPEKKSTSCHKLGSEESQTKGTKANSSPSQSHQDDTEVADLFREEMVFPSETYVHIPEVHLPTVKKIPVPNRSVYLNKNQAVINDDGSCVYTASKVIKKQSPAVRNVRINIVQPLKSPVTEKKPPRVVYASRDVGMFISKNTDPGRRKSEPQDQPHVTIKKVRLSSGEAVPTKTGPVSANSDGYLLSPDQRNKRKRYMPLRSPLLSVTNCSEGGDEMQYTDTKHLG